MIQAVRGTKDILPEISYKWQIVEEKIREQTSRFCFQEIRVPIFEKTEVFSRGIGENTDVVGKEMYTFLDRGNESITLRPEGTASVVRAVIENSLIQQNPISRLWYLGPFFRYERPQKGRLRQFHQFGAECLGSNLPESDIEIINLATSCIESLGINDYNLIINSLGNENSRLNYRNSLVEYLNDNKNKLSEDSQKRLDTNPLRVLDSKSKEDQEVIKNAPIILDYLDEESNEHFNTVKEMLSNINIKYSINPKLVRGLDYYSHTVFEFQHQALGAQDSFGGGGRYNGLFEQLGGKSTPAVGFAMGLERILLILDEINALPVQDSFADVFVITSNTNIVALASKISNELRKTGLKVLYDVLRRSMKAQMREANRVLAKYCIILGEEELKNNKVIIKNLKNSEQVDCLIENVTDFFKNNR